MFKNLLAYIPIISLSVALIAGWVKLSISSESNKTEIVAIKADVKEITRDKDELDKKVSVNANEQANLGKQVQQVNDKLDKVVDLLIKMKEAK